MKKHADAKRKIQMLAAWMIMLLLFTVPAGANTIMQDGIEVSLRTDKESYEAFEKAEARLVVTNAGTLPMENVRMSIQAPEGFVLLNGNSNETQIAQLNAGASGEHCGSVGGEDYVHLPGTGDGSHGIFWAAVFVLSCSMLGMTAVRRGQGKRLISLLLCAAILCPVLTIPVEVKAESADEHVITICKEVLVNGETVVLTGTVTYEVTSVAGVTDGERLSITDGEINGQTQSVTVHMGDTLSFSGVISAPEGDTLSAVHVFVYDADAEEPYTMGEKYFSASGLNAKTFDLVQIPEMIVGDQFGAEDGGVGFAMEEGGRYDVMFYAADSAGRSFADANPAVDGDQGPAIRVNVKTSPSNCSHPHDTYVYSLHSSGQTRVMNYGDELMHQIEPLYERYCGLCDLYLMDIWGQGTGEAHTMVDGVCSVCAYGGVMLLAEDGELAQAPTLTVEQDEINHGDQYFWSVSHPTADVIEVKTESESVDGMAADSGNFCEYESGGEYMGTADRYYETDYIITLTARAWVDGASSALAQQEIYVVYAAAESGDYQYTVSNGKATITGYLGADADVTIPGELDGYPVSNIDAFAFDGTDVKTITIPSSLTELSDGGFYGCDSLTDIYTHKNLWVDTYAFGGCAAGVKVHGYSGGSVEAAANACGCTFVSLGSLSSAAVPVVTVPSQVNYGDGFQVIAECAGAEEFDIWYGVESDTENYSYSFVTAAEETGKLVDSWYANMTPACNYKMTFKVSACIDGEWTAYSAPATVSVVYSANVLKAPQIDIPARVAVHEDLIISWDPVEHAEEYEVWLIPVSDTVKGSYPIGSSTPGESEWIIPAEKLYGYFYDETRDELELKVEVTAKADGYSPSKGEAAFTAFIYTLGEPQIAGLPQSIRPGDYATVTWEAVEHSEKADSVYYEFYLAHEDGEEQMIGSFQENGEAEHTCTLSFPADLAEGSYTLRVLATANGMGLKDSDSEHGIQIEDAEVDPTNVILVSADKTEVTIGETVNFSVYAPNDEYIEMYLDGVLINTYYIDTPSDTKSISYSFDEAGEKRISFRAMIDGKWVEADKDLIIRVTVSPEEEEDTLSFSVDKTQVTTGEIVTFTVNAPGAAQVQMIVDGDVIETLDMSGDSLTFGRAFTQPGERETTFCALIDGEWTQPCAVQVITVTSAGKLDAPVPQTKAVHLVGEDVFVSWAAVANASGYAVRVYDAEGNGVYLNNITATEVTIASDVFVSPAVYTISVMAYGENYDQSEGSTSTEIVQNLPAVKLPNVQLENLNSGDVVTDAAFTVSWKDVQLTQGMAFGGYCVLLEKHNGTAYVPVLLGEDVYYAYLGSDTQYALDMLEAGGSYRLHVFTLEEGCVEPNGEKRLHGETVVDFSYRIVPAFEIASVSGGDLGDPVTVKWNAPAWPHKSLVPEFYMVSLIGPDGKQIGDAVRVQSDAAREYTFTGESVAAMGSYTVCVAARMASWDTQTYRAEYIATAEWNVGNPAIVSVERTSGVYQYVNDLFEYVVEANRQTHHIRVSVSGCKDKIFTRENRDDDFEIRFGIAKPGIYSVKFIPETYENEKGSDRTPPQEIYVIGRIYPYQTWYVSAAEAPLYSLPGITTGRKIACGEAVEVRGELDSYFYVFCNGGTHFVRKADLSRTAVESWLDISAAGRNWGVGKDCSVTLNITTSADIDAVEVYAVTGDESAGRILLDVLNMQGNAAQRSCEFTVKPAQSHSRTVSGREIEYEYFVKACSGGENAAEGYFTAYVIPEPNERIHLLNKNPNDDKYYYYNIYDEHRRVILEGEYDADGNRICRINGRVTDSHPERGDACRFVFNGAEYAYIEFDHDGHKMYGFTGIAWVNFRRDEIEKDRREEFYELIRNLGEDESPIQNPEIRRIMYERLHDDGRNLSETNATNVLQMLMEAPRLYADLYVYSFYEYDFGNLYADDGSYYEAGTLNISAEMADSNSFIYTWFHESGHAIDFNTNEGGGFTRNDENKQKLFDYIKKEVEEIVRDEIKQVMEKEIGLFSKTQRILTEEEQDLIVAEIIGASNQPDENTAQNFSEQEITGLPQSQRLERLENPHVADVFDEVINNLSHRYSFEISVNPRESYNGSMLHDMISGMTNNTVLPSMGHASPLTSDQYYWYDEDGTPTYYQNLEAFAEFFCGRITRTNDDNISNFPEATRLMSEMAVEMYNYYKQKIMEG